MRLYAAIYLIGYILLIATLFVVPFFSFEGYSLTEHTLSDLGAQKVSGNWITNTTIIFLSCAIIPLATKQLQLHWRHLACLYFFCISFLFTGIYQLAGLDAHQYVFDYTDDALHYLFSLMSGFAFCLFCIFFIFIVRKKRHKWQTLGALSLAVIVPVLIYYYPEYKGVFQRALYLGTFGWLFYALTTYPLIEGVFKGAR